MNPFNEKLIAQLKKDQDLDLKQLDQYVKLTRDLQELINQRSKVISTLIKHPAND